MSKSVIAPHSLIFYLAGRKSYAIEMHISTTCRTLYPHFSHGAESVFVNSCFKNLEFSVNKGPFLLYQNKLSWLEIYIILTCIVAFL